MREKNASNRLGHIRQRGNSWQVVIYIGIDPITEKQQFYYKSFPTAKEAKVHLVSKLNERNERKLKKPSQLNMSEMLTKWLNQGDKSRERTRNFNKYVIDRYVIPHIGKVKLQQLDHTILEQLYGSLGNSGCGAATIRRIHAVISSALKWAARQKLVEGSTVSEIKTCIELPKIEKKKLPSIGQEQAIRFLDVASRDRFHALWVLALETGMRPCEYLGLRWADIDFTLGIVTVRHSLVWYPGGRFQLTKPKTDKAERNLPLSPELQTLLIAHRSNQKGEKKEAGLEWEDHGLVFSTIKGTPIRKENLTKRHYKPILKEAGLPDLRLYDLRHAIATILIEQGEHVRTIADRLGHADPTLVLRTYGHVLPSMQHTTTNAIRRALYQGGSPQS